MKECYSKWIIIKDRVVIVVDLPSNLAHIDYSVVAGKYLLRSYPGPAINPP